MSEAAAPEQQQPTEFEQWDKLTDDAKVAAETAAAKPAEEAKPAEAKPAAEPKPAEAKPAAAEPKDEEDYDSLPAWARKRIAKQSAKIRDLQANVDETPARPPAAEAKPAAAAAPPAEGRPVRPKLADFATYELYEDALESHVEKLTEWSAAQLRAKEQAAETARQRETAEATEREAWTKQVDAAKTEHDDFDEVALNPKLPITELMFHVMKATGNGAELLYHLGEHPELAESISKGSPAAQALAIGKLDEKLFPEAAAAEAKKPASISRAPKPPKPVGAGAGTADLGREPDPTDFVAWSKWMDRQEAAKAA